LAIRKFLAAQTALGSGLLLLAAGAAVGAKAAEPPPAHGAIASVRVDRQIVHSPAIAGNLLGTSAERQVFVVLPPTYSTHPRRRYPVVYALHGFGTGPQEWMAELHAKAGIERAYAARTPEMILVFPDGSNEYGGSFYTSSAATGDFERFIADELATFIDSHYRTIANSAARGLMGHSMGGYGTARIAALDPGRFGAIYLMSPCCLAPLGPQGLNPERVAVIEALKSPAAAVGLPFIYAGPLATAAAFSPDPLKPPLFVDLAIDARGTPREEILAKRAANAPLAFFDQHVAAFRTYAKIGIDVGDQDTIVPTASALHKELDSYAIANQFEIYSGTHTSRVAERFESTVLPFFGGILTKAAP